MAGIAIAEPDAPGTVSVATAPRLRTAPAVTANPEPWLGTVPEWGRDTPDRLADLLGGGRPAPGPRPAHEASVLATVAHELRGPLTALATSSELLAEDFEVLDPTQVRGMLASIHRRAVWLQGLVENLLCAATIREGRLQLRHQPVSLVDLVSDVQAVVEPLLAQRAQRLKVRGTRQAREVSADARRLGQVLINLILNASKFGPAGSAIEVSFRRRGRGWLRVAVADRGPGISPERADRLFDPYYRDPSASRKDGVGLGLSIVKSIVEAHGGEVGVERRPGGGACFWFLLPADAPAP